MDIRQLSVRYHTDHDRILVSINTSASEEVQMWFTRRLTMRLWPLINRVVIDHFAIPQDAKTDGYVDLSAMGPKTREMLAELRRMESVAASDFATPYQAKAVTRPLGDAPLLVTEVNLTPKDGGQLQMNFKESLDAPPSNRGFQLDMPAELVFGLIELISHALAQSQWNLGTESPSAAQMVEGSVDEVDLAPNAARPTYLN